MEHKEDLAQRTLEYLQSQGHDYVDLRKDGKDFVFFCTLCLTPCYSKAVLYDHLNGKLHTRLLGPTMGTLLLPHPWPFNDGMVSFPFSSRERNNQGSSSESSDHVNIDNSQFIEYEQNDDLPVGSTDETNESKDEDSDAYSFPYSLAVHDVLYGDELLDIGARLLGIGKIGARIFLKDEGSPEVCRIWSEWFGIDQHLTSEDASDHDFAVIIFPYDTNLGRDGLVCDTKYLLSSRTWGETADDSNHGTKKSKRDVSEPSNRGESSHGATPSLGSSSSRMLLDCQGDDQLLISKFMASRTNRKDLRKYETVKSKKVCPICCHKMLPGKDVAALLNIETGKLACSSTNHNREFHIFHISCLIYWILLSENEIYKQQMGNPKMKQKSRRKTVRKCNKSKEVAEVKVQEKDLRKQIDCMFCPECQGTGIQVEEDEHEEDYIDLHEIFRYKLKVGDGKREWMKSPGMLENCSIGLHFPPESEEPVQEQVIALKLLRFYRADL